MLADQALDEANIEAAVNAALKNATILGDHFASEDYRRHLARVYLKKALQAVA